ncbi:putative uncharacterized protein [Clostridium sp. CAG:470]|nr:MAG: hypothetical protein BHW03_04105 [Clostridium sp. 28_17]CDE14851.1 putative uncharacterized protein [Clostridium sp. CAG:470]
MNFKDKVFLITGSTSGIGQGIAKSLLEEGAKVVINYGHDEKKAEETRRLFEKYQDRSLFIKADISKENDVINMYKKIEEKFNRLDGLVNNDVNVIARWMCIKNAIPLLKKSNMPRVVNIASRLGTKPIQDSVAYCTSEAATIILTQCCALELTPKYNIKVNTVSPSMTLTPLAKKSYTEDEIKQTAMKNPSGRLGEVKDTVNAVLFLLSEEADYINGENLNVNGGILLV